MEHTPNSSGWPKPGTQATPPGLPPMCRNCRRVLQPDFKFCPHCGSRQDQGSAWYYHPAFILFLALTVAGPLVLPLVWRSQRMKMAGKVLMSAVIILYTVYAVYLAYKVLALELSFSSELGDMMRQIHTR
jgi:hypothetical protein